MKAPSTKQSGFTPTLTFKQSIVKDLKICKKSILTWLDEIVTRRERSSQLKSQCRGFTLVEMIVSLGLFSVVVTISVGALLMLIASNQQLQKEQSVMTNLSFAIDTMSREMRTGTHYYCTGVNGTTNSTIFENDNLDDLPETGPGSRKDCPAGPQPGTSGHYYTWRGVAFKEGGDSITGGTNKRILYFFDESQHKLFRRIGTEDAQSIVSSGIYIENVLFFVSGTTLGADQWQPAVTIYIEAKEKEDADKTYQIETTVTQRTLDI